MNACRRSRPKNAVALFQLNTEAYPNSANAYDSLGDGYAADGQNEKAIQASQKALELLPADKGIPEPYRDLALLRATTLEFDKLKPEEVISRLEPITKPGNPWFGSAGELTAMAYIKQGHNDQAGRLFAAIAADKQVPDTIRSRAVQIAGTLGVDASAAQPAQPGSSE